MLTRSWLLRNDSASVWGGVRATEAVGFLREGNLTAAFDLVLYYYDKAYSYYLEKRQASVCRLDVSGRSALEAAKLLLDRLTVNNWVG